MERTFTANTLEELEAIWRDDLMNKGWDIEKPISTKWSWSKLGYVYYFVAKKLKEHTLTQDQLDKADMYYCIHKNHVNKLCSMAECEYPPSLNLDKRNPDLWKPEHWQWFLNNYR